uniref:Nucleoside diphosphate kinase n=1 Tax=Oncorhynchus mykiss TaxID=8022 RepID=A0A8C7LWH8_ONCMY
MNHFVALLSRYQLLFYQKDGSVEMFDVKNQRTLLRRTKCHDLHQEDLFVGEPCECYTGNKLGSKKERYVWFNDSYLKGWERSLIACCFTFHLFVCVCVKQAADFYTEHQTNFFMLGFSATWKQFMISGPGVAMELMDLGPTDWDVARKEARPSLRAQVGTDHTRNAGHGSDSLASAARVSHSSRENRRGPSTEPLGTAVERTADALILILGGHQ